MSRKRLKMTRAEASERKRAKRASEAAQRASRIAGPAGTADNRHRMPDAARGAEVLERAFQYRERLLVLIAKLERVPEWRNGRRKELIRVARIESGGYVRELERWLTHYDSPSVRAAAPQWLIADLDEVRRNMEAEERRRSAAEAYDKRYEEARQRRRRTPMDDGEFLEYVKQFIYDR